LQTTTTSAGMLMKFTIKKIKMLEKEQDKPEKIANIMAKIMTTLCQE